MTPSKGLKSQTSENNKRIAKNTLLLYFRMLIIMIVSLFTVRIVLNTLGVTDYGIYNVVGGIVVMFSFLSNTMAAASQRFFAFELGRNDFPQLKKTFSLTMSIYIMLSIVILILAETVGLWFLNNKMTIPETRIVAARWVYQFSILSFLMTMFSIPYHAAIIAHERMKVYAYVSILEATLKLIIVYLLVIFTYDKLKLYAILVFLVTSMVTTIYRFYCIYNFEESKYSFYWEKNLFKELIAYSGWNLFGALSGVLNKQGINIILNIFFGPIVNAARGIAYQVSSSINQFVSNFMTATGPQIIKYYAAKEKQQMLLLIYRSSKLSYLLLFIISMPVLIETKYIFNLWLKEVPDYAVLFSRLVIITALIDSLSLPLMTAAQSTGRIKKYQLIVGSMLMLNLPISYFFFKLGFPPQTAMFVAIFISTLCLFLRLWLLVGMVELSIIHFLKNVIFPIITITTLAYIIPLLIKLNFEEGIYRFFSVAFTGLIISGLVTYKFGLSKTERNYLVLLIKKKLRVNNKKIK